MKKLALILVAIFVVAAAAYLYVFHKPHRDIVGEKASLSLNASSLVEEYSKDQTLANAEYLDEVLVLTGTLAERGEDYLKLEEGVYASLAENLGSLDLQQGDKLKLKGRVVGYDELFMEVRLDNCILLSE